jgi:hypothetical protein
MPVGITKTVSKKTTQELNDLNSPPTINPRGYEQQHK